METFYPFFIVLFVGVFFSMVFRRIHVPWVVGLIAGGMAIGPQGLNWLEVGPTVDFIGQLGLIFLMFMAGLESKLSDFKEFRTGLLGLAFVNGAIPFIFGVGIGFLLGYGWISSLLIGTIFVSSSIAVVIPSLENHGLLKTKLGQSVVITSVIQDITSLVMLSLLLQNINPVSNLPLPLFYALLVGTLLLFRYILPRATRLLTFAIKGSQDRFQQEFRAVFVVLIGTVLVFELLGLHPIIAGFFAGLVLSDSLQSKILKDKIRTISYGVFIPTFFIIIGAETDLSVFQQANEALLVIALVVVASVFSKFISGWFGARMVGFKSDEALLFAISSIPQLSTTLAVAFTALTLGLVDSKLITAMVTLSIVTVLVSPTLMNIFEERLTKAAEQMKESPVEKDEK